MTHAKAHHWHLIAAIKLDSGLKRQLVFRDVLVLAFRHLGVPGEIWRAT